MWYSRTGYRWQYSSCALHTGYVKGYKHTLTKCNTYCSSTDTMVARTDFNVTVHVHCLCCCNENWCPMINLWESSKGVRVCILNRRCSNKGQLRLQPIVLLYLSNMHNTVYHWMKILLHCTTQRYCYRHVLLKDTDTVMYQCMIMILTCTNKWYSYCHTPKNETDTYMYHWMILISAVNTAFRKVIEQWRNKV